MNMFHPMNAGKKGSIVQQYGFHGEERTKPMDAIVGVPEMTFAKYGRSHSYCA
jgi:hypothetical protein